MVNHGMTITTLIYLIDQKRSKSGLGQRKRDGFGLRMVLSVLKRLGYVLS